MSESLFSIASVTRRFYRQPLPSLLAPILELLSLLAIATFWLWREPVTSFLLACAAGLGWCVVGKAQTGIRYAAIRGVVLVGLVLLFVAFVRDSFGGCGDFDDRCPPLARETATLLFGIVLVVFAATPLASAALLFRQSIRR